MDFMAKPASPAAFTDLRDAGAGGRAYHFDPYLGTPPGSVLVSW
jgi:hypothetical protein